MQTSQSSAAGARPLWNSSPAHNSPNARNSRTRLGLFAAFRGRDHPKTSWNSGVEQMYGPNHAQFAQLSPHQAAYRPSFCRFPSFFSTFLPCCSAKIGCQGWPIRTIGALSCRTLSRSDLWDSRKCGHICESVAHRARNHRHLESVPGRSRGLGVKLAVNHSPRSKLSNKRRLLGGIADFSRNTAASGRPLRRKK